MTHRPGDLLPGRSDEPKWVATDPETGCRGVGEFEEEARATLVHAVQAYHGQSDGATPLIATRQVQTVEMSGLGDDASLSDRLRDLSPF